MSRQVVISDIRLIIRGLFILLTIVAVGVGIVEHQMATLTQRPAKEHLESGVVVTITNYISPLLSKIEIDRVRLGYWFAIWHQQFVEEAFTAKKTAGEYWRRAKPYVEAALQTLRVKTGQVVQQMDEYIREYR